MSPTFRRYLVSSITTFATGFIIALAGQLMTGTITPENVSWGIVGSLIYTAGRAALKPLVESWMGLTGDPLPPAPPAAQA